MYNTGLGLIVQPKNPGIAQINYMRQRMKGLWYKYFMKYLTRISITTLLPYAAGLAIMFFTLLSQAGLPVASDINIHYSQTIGFLESFVDNPGYPDWNAMEAGLRGSPTFRFAGPIPLLVAALLQLVGLSALNALKLTPIIFALMGAIGIQHWFKTGKWKYGKLAVFLFLTNPVLAINTRFLFFFQNLCAVLLTPWLFSAWENNKNNQYNTNQGAAVMGIIMLCHIQTGVMLAAILAICTIIDSLLTRNLRPVKTFVIINLLAAMLAGPYLLPVFMSQNLIKAPEIGLSLAPGTGSLFLDDSFTTAEGAPMGRVDGLLSLLSYARNNTNQPVYAPHSWEVIRPWFYWALLLWLSLAAAGFYLSARKEKVKAYSIAGLAASCLAFSFTKAIWPLIPAGQAIQFAFRWVFPASIVLIPAISSMASLKGKARFLLVLLAGPAIMSSLLIKAALFFPAGHEQSFAINRVTIAEMLPVTVPAAKSQSLKPLERIHQLAIPGSKAKVRGSGGFNYFTYDFSEEISASPFSIFTYYDPFWRVNINGKDLPIRHDENGYISGLLPGGTKRIRLYRVTPVGRNIGWLTALIAIMTIAGMAKLSLKPEKNSLN